jgi:hypothetical protein
VQMDQRSGIRNCKRPDNFPRWVLLHDSQAIVIKAQT